MRDELALRASIVETARRLNGAALNQGKSGNLSVRIAGDRFLVTPSGMPYEALAPGDIVEMGLDGSVATGALEPSSEWAIHRDVYLHRPEAAAVLHAHAPHATALSCTRRGIPPFHYMVAAAGGHDIRCADYATFGTVELSQHVLRALEGRRACLMANHGLLTCGATLAAAFDLAVEVEALAAQYMRAIAAGGPVLLSADEMDRVLAKFATYGRPRPRG